MQAVWLRLDSFDAGQVGQAKALLGRYPGSVPVVLVDGPKRIAKNVPPELYVDASEAFLAAAAAAYGKDNVITK